MKYNREDRIVLNTDDARMRLDVPEGASGRIVQPAGKHQPTKVLVEWDQPYKRKTVNPHYPAVGTHNRFYVDEKHLDKEVSEEEGIKVGDTVTAWHGVDSIHYIQKRKRYLTVLPGMSCKVVRIAHTGKIGVEFDHPIFTEGPVVSSLDNGCHGSGKMHHCIYLPAEFLRKADGKSPREIRAELLNISMKDISDPFAVDPKSKLVRLLNGPEPTMCLWMARPRMIDITIDVVYGVQFTNPASNYPLSDNDLLLLTV